MISITPLSEPLAEDAVQPVADGRADGQGRGNCITADALAVDGADCVILGHRSGIGVGELAEGHRLGPPAPAATLGTGNVLVNHLTVNLDGFDILGGLHCQRGGDPSSP